MSNIAIEFNNVGKMYRLGLVGTGTLSDDLNRWWTMNVLRKEDPYLKIGQTNDRTTKGDSDYVWALRDISFKVEQGDVVGIIGKNGAGKSTLLKLLSHITAPTTGNIRYNGRIASLLEVGTGFHPEMTGRENIYMNGSIMGMTKAEITRKLDEIVDFAGVERYLDTPTKRYSSGMKVRLGFAVAAFLEPEILVVDEVLAVGDLEFQKKALGKMQNISSQGGRTVLFVSHNMGAVRSLCNRGIVLKDGMVDFVGSVDSAITHYVGNSMDAYSGLSLRDIPHENRGNGRVRIVDCMFLGRDGQPISPRSGSYLKIRLSLSVHEETIKKCNISMGIRDMFGSPLMTMPSHMSIDDFDLVKGINYADLILDRLPLAGGVYRIGIYCSVDTECADLIENVIRLDVIDDDYYGRGKSINEDFKGKVVLCDYKWEIKR